MDVSSMNVIKGTITEIKESVIIATVQVNIGGGYFISHTVMIDDVADLELHEGDEVYTLIKDDTVRLVKELEADGGRPGSKSGEHLCTNFAFPK